ncbi:MAG: hypothetical protein ABR507_09625 [Actinomycetota bacterium]|nr:hypothetical protein [Actinomycetota bacterium]
MSKQTVQQEIATWFGSRIPDGWFEGDLEVQADHEEVLVVGTLGAPTGDAPTGDTGADEVKAKADGFRESTRDARIEIALEAERLFNRKVSWGVKVGDKLHLFTGLAVPVMTRLRLRERSLLDTLVAAGVARSRSDAVAWCTRLVAHKQSEWISDLKEAFQHVEKVRDQGPAPE